MVADPRTGCALMALPLLLAMWTLYALVFYGVVLIIFRYAFGVELPNPFNWIR